MKQRIRVVGIVSKGDDILLLKRSLGRVEMDPIWELPTAKISFGEQPEEAMARSIDEYLGIEVEKIELKDVITFVALSGSSRLYNLYIIYNICDMMQVIISKQIKQRSGFVNEKKRSKRIK